jgi:hypothetical protein
MHYQSVVIHLLFNEYNRLIEVENKLQEITVLCQYRSVLSNMLKQQSSSCYEVIRIDD